MSLVLSHVTVVFTCLTKMATPCSKLCHLTDKNVTEFAVLIEKGGKEMKVKRERIKH